MGGKSLGPLIKAIGTGAPGANASGAGDVAYSQYGRNRCAENAFFTAKDAKHAHTQCTAVRYMGYSVRTPQFRLTEWALCNVTSGRPRWDAPNATLASLELYAHPGGEAESDDFDASEPKNLAYNPEQADTVARLRALLRKGFKIDGE